MTRHFLSAALMSGLLVGNSVAMASPAHAATVPHFQNCTVLHETYQHGVAKKGARDQVRGSTKPVTTFITNTAVYRANLRLDRDRDGVACEKR